MKENNKIEERLQNMKDFYLKADKLIDGLPDVIPQDKKDFIKKSILGDEELKHFMDGIDNHRPPRIFLVGRTGVGKSSLINALCGAYIAEVSDTRSCTEGAEIYQCKVEDRVLMEILDTRGIAESESLDESVSAEENLFDEVDKFSPDVAIFMLNCTHRDDVKADALFLKAIAKKYEERNQVRLPIVVVINKSDEMVSSRHKNPKEYPQNKIDKIYDVVKYYKGIIVNSGLKFDNIIPVASLIDWQTPDGIEVDVESIKNLPQTDIENLKISFDGRYNIEELFNILESAIQDYEAQVGLRMAARLNEVVERMANHIIKIFLSIASVIALTPIPIADLYVLLILQSVLVALIAALSGRELSIEAAKEFILSLISIGGAGFAFRIIAQQGSKLLNGLFPGAGSTVSATVAAGGTYSIGKAAVAYYIEEKDIEEVKGIFKKMSKEKK